MKKWTRSFGAIIIVVSAPTLAQERVDVDMIARIKDEALSRSSVMQVFNVYTNIIGPRLTGTPALKQAMDWSLERVTDWGLENAHLESWEFGRGWTLEGLTLEMTTPRYFPLIGYPEAWTPSTDGVTAGQPVYIGGKTADEIRAMASELRGRIVLAYQPQPEFIVNDRLQPTESATPVRIGAPPSIRAAAPVDRRELAGLLEGVGAAVHLAPNQGQHGTVFVLGGRNTTNDAVPTVLLAAEHYNMIVRLLEHGEPVSLRVGVSARYHEDDTNGYNLIAEIPGSDPAVRDEVVMIGAHLDSWHAATGATDNADASASVMEAMRILEALGARPRRTIRMALWSGEEQGLLGAREYVRRHYEGDAHREARERFNVYFNHDPGTGPVYGFYAEENTAAKVVFDAWLAPLRDVGARQNQIERIGSTDHLAFIRAGMPGFNTVQEYRDYDVRNHHTNMDFYERLSEHDLQQSAIVLAVFAWHAAMRGEKIPRN
jgi:carboxypeptidase Q